MSNEKQAEILDLLKKVQSLGVDFAFASESGWRTISAEQVVSLSECDDADKLNAELMGKTLEEFREWREWYTSGRAESFQCLGTTVQGKRCRRHVMTSAHNHSFDAWKTLKDGGGYCPTHGG
jgi:hypothetical protein